MTKKRLLYLTLIVATLTIGVVIGTIVSGGVKAGEQKAVPLVIPDPVSLSNAFSKIADDLDPTVVNISTEAAPDNPIPVSGRNRSNRNNPNQDPRQLNPFDLFGDFFGSPDQPDPNEKVRSLGTGFIVDKAGYILTNHHVVDKATKITVRLEDKSEYNAKVIGSDDKTDLAVIKIEVGHDLPIAKLGNSDSVKVGDWVLAIGSPFSLDHTVTAGIISAKGRTQLPGSSNNGDFQSFLQTDAAINPGNSGGPLVNMGGEVIGINTAIISETRQSAGLGFALPSNTAVKIYNQLVSNGKVTRGGIGISYEPNQPTRLCRALGLKADCGVVVQTVTPGGPAAKAGLREGDVITEIDGVQTPNGAALLDVVANSAVGKTIRVKINRDGKDQTIPVTIVDRNQITATETSSNGGGGGGGGGRDNGGDQGEAVGAKLGIRVQSITPDMVRQLRLNSSDGVFVSSVDQDSVAEDAGIQRGTIITKVIAGNERLDIRNLDDFRRAERVMKSGMDVAFMVMTRNQQTSEYRSGFVAITIP